MKKKTKINLKIFVKVLIVFLFIIAAIFTFIAIRNKLTQPLAHVKPSYDKVSIESILDKSKFTENDYKTLFYQTGLGKDAVDTILEDKTNGKDRILKMQENLFKDVIINQEMITPITYQESLINNEGKLVFGTELAPFENGYILVTRGTYSLGWRHGHAAIVIDSEHSYTLEAAVLGQDSQIMGISKWKYYPNFMILKLKNSNQEELDKISKYAVDTISKVPYRLTTGIFSSKYKEGIEPIGTHCSHLVWYPFMAHGYDLDFDGGMIVTPMDIANSPLLEIVQVYGFDPKELWK